MKLYAFWSHGSFPFVLGGTVTRMKDNGAVETKEYGKNYWFRPIKVVPLKTGLAIQKRLDALREQHDKAEKTFRREWQERSKAMLAVIDRGEGDAD